MAKSWDWVGIIFFLSQLIPTGDVPNFCHQTSLSDLSVSNHKTYFSNSSAYNHQNSILDPSVQDHQNSILDLVSDHQTSLSDPSVSIHQTFLLDPSMSNHQISLSDTSVCVQHSPVPKLPSLTQGDWPVQAVYPTHSNPGQGRFGWPPSPGP